jgi:phage shock protein PspC (stress-responsive transcriptional regulator)
MDKRLYRSRSDRMLGGVCGGLGAYFNVDPSLVRLAFVLLLVFGGSGFLLYLILWIVLPEEGRVYGSTEETTRANAQEIANRARQFGEDMKSAFGGSAASGAEGSADAASTGLLPEPQRAPASSVNSAAVFGVILIGIGAIFLLGNILPGFSFWRWWPAILVLIGGAILVNQFRK